MRLATLALAAALLSACKPETAPRLTVAAAANLTEVCAELGRAFTAHTGIEVSFSYGSTAQLATQIDNGAPFDVFAAADSTHVTGKNLTSPAIYALGQLAVWSPNATPRTLNDLTKLRFIAIAQPDAAPYGQAAVEALKQAGLWDTLQPKIVYGGNINQAKQLAASGNADAAFTAYSLVLHEKGTVLKVPQTLHKKLEQSVAIVTNTPHKDQAQQFRAFLLGKEGRGILERAGYLLPPQ